MTKGEQVAVKSASSSDTSGLVTTIASGDLQAAIGTGKTKLALVVNAAAEAGKASKLSLPTDQVLLLTTAPAGSALYVTTGKEAVGLPLSILKSTPVGSGIELIIQQAAGQTANFSGVSVAGTPVSYELNTVSGTRSHSIPN